MEKEKKNTEKNFIVMLLILIALIIIIFLLVRNLGFIDHRPKIPTGNVDIFDINFGKKCQNNCCNCNCNNNTGDSSNNNNNNNNNEGNYENVSGEPNNNGSPNIPTSPDNPTIEEDKDGIEVFDKQTEYSQNTPLRIFTNTAYYVVDDKIAPTSENSYQFVIRNNNEFNIKYNLELFENNKYNVNMKYRLKLNGVYVAGNNDDWLTYEELKQEGIVLSANTYDVYTLDWKWFEGINDTEVGTNINSDYKLELKITASGY